MDDKTCTAVMKTAIKLFEAGKKMGDIIEVIKGLYPSHPNAAQAARCGIDMYASLMLAVDKAGGVCRSIDELSKMSVMDLISRLATNDVRFTCTRNHK